MPYIDDATWNEMLRNLEQAKENLRHTQLEQEIINSRLDELEKQRAEEFRNEGYWDEILMDFCDSKGIGDEQPVLEEHFPLFVSFINERYPMCMDLVFDIWRSWFNAYEKD